eukprot:TRINITY_DN363_c0_g1_i1.p1 TRINITY_DN363_c0_g1~~TRINITY_DN363_c0_g1_i1.p1  ORF type:complete len:519 (+),score=174.20 TRINITY_DN363_c0_g1_i1:153-1709(+)
MEFSENVNKSYFDNNNYENNDIDGFGNEFKDTSLNFDDIVINIPTWELIVDDNDSFVVYNIEVQTKNKKWTIKKRYSQLRAFHEAISVIFKEAKLTKFPPKKFFTKKTDEGLCNERQQEIEDYFQYLIRIDEIRISDLFLDLFEVLKHFKEKGLNKIILAPLPDKEFDPSECSIPWKMLTSVGATIIFATENGDIPKCDQMLIHPEGLVEKILGTEPEAKSFYLEMEQDENFQNPIRWEDIEPSDYDGLLLTGGHSPGMKQYLESKILQDKIVQFTKLNRPTAAICHGVLLLGRCKDENGVSVIHKRRVTTLTKQMENFAFQISRSKHGNLYKTYPEIYCEDEVRSFLQNDETQFDKGNNVLLSLGAKGTMYDDTHAFVVRDDNLLTGRYPGDAYLFGRTFISLLSDFVREDPKENYFREEDEEELILSNSDFVPFQDNYVKNDNYYNNSLLNNESNEDNEDNDNNENNNFQNQISSENNNDINMQSQFNESDPPYQNYNDDLNGFYNENSSNIIIEN